MAERLGTVENLGLSCTKSEDEVGKRTESLDDLLLNVIDETLRHVFKEPGAKVIYDYLRKQCHLKREEIVEKPEVFSAGLKRLLKSGAVAIEKMILKNLSARLQLKYEEKEGYEFSDYLKELMERNSDVEA